jgi:acyl CoA:acetate/3-ketoacid CoA transferase alpha subunit
VIAMAASTVIVCADNIVPIGVISPDHVVTPAPVVDFLVANARAAWTRRPSSRAALPGS